MTGSSRPPAEHSAPLIERWFSLDSQIEFGRQYHLRFGDTYDPKGNAHSDRDFARSLGLPDAIGHSSQYYAWMAEAGLVVFGKDWLDGGEIQARFRAPVFPGDRLRVATTVARPETTDDAATGLVAVSDAGVTAATGIIEQTSGGI